MIGDELWTLARALGGFYDREETIALVPWGFEKYFSIPHEFFKDDVDMPIPPLTREAWGEIAMPIRDLLQPSPDALKELMELESFFALEPPILGVHVSPNLPDEYYAEAISLLPHTSIAIFGDDPDEEDREEAGVWYFEEEDMAWAVPHLMSFCTHHVTSDSADSWWGAFLSDSEGVVYPSPNPNGIFPTSWKPINV